MGRDLFSFADEYPHEPGFKETGGTSEEAAREITAKAATLRARTLNVLIENPDGLTADEIAAQLGEHWSNIRPRCSELFGLGLIFKTERRRPSANGGALAVVFVARP